MCKFPAFTLLFALAAFSVQAQMADRLSEHPATKVREAAPSEVMSVTREMATRLRLNEGQFLKLLPLNHTKLTGLSNINRDYKNDEATRNAKAAELEAQYEQECSRILTPSQLSQLQHPAPQPAAEPVGTGTGLG